MKRWKWLLVLCIGTAFVVCAVLWVHGRVFRCFCDERDTRFLVSDCVNDVGLKGRTQCWHRVLAIRSSTIYLFQCADDVELLTSANDQMESHVEELFIREFSQFHSDIRKIVEQYPVEGVYGCTRGCDMITLRLQGDRYLVRIFGKGE